MSNRGPRNPVSEEPLLSGFLNLYKPSGMTSRKVVDAVERLVRPAKVGHAGTLDPLAEGVLVVGVGQATRLLSYVQRMPKHYVGTFLLGRRSETEDVEGTVFELPAAPRPTEEAIKEDLREFHGGYEQTPPAYSALKVSGRRAYQLARQKREVTLAPRRVAIYGLAVQEYAYPKLVLEIECGGGTYVRTLGRDVARRLGTDAVMSALVRRAVGHFRAEDACGIEKLSRQSITALLRPLADAVGALPRLELSSEDVEELRHGRRIERGQPPGEEEFAGFAADGRLVSILGVGPEGRLRPTRNFLSPSGPTDG